VSENENDAMRHAPCDGKNPKKRSKQKFEARGSIRPQQIQDCNYSLEDRYSMPFIEHVLIYE
jgi:hypothetical protein